MNPLDNAGGGSVLVLAPAGRDARLAASVLSEQGIATRICSSVQEFVAALNEEPAVALLTEHALTAELRRQLHAWLETQPLWSDLPLVVLAGHPPNPEGKRQLAAVLAELGNVTVVERPMHSETLVSTVRAALRARGRQHQARELLSKLEEAIRERDQFLAMLSHELRNPLGAIRNATEVLSRRIKPQAEAERPLAIVDRQTKHLGRLVDDLLDVARVSTGKIALRKDTCELGELIERAARQVESAIAQGGLRLRTRFAQRPIMLDADPVRIEQVIGNLLTNAVKYTPAGGTIDVIVEVDEHDAVVHVIDSGVGIAPEMLGSVFNMFVQADRSLDRAQGGMGIGLTLVRLLVELHGGHVSATSAGPGRGSEFTVTLPLAARENVAPAHTPAPEPGTRRHVLLVEDSVDNREMLQALLEMDGHRVDVAADGLEAVEQGVALKPDVAIIDIGLPGIDGYEVAQRLRASLGQGIVLVALTGYGQPEDRAKAKKAGFNVHLIKPVGLPELEAALQV